MERLQRHSDGSAPQGMTSSNEDETMPQLRHRMMEFLGPTSRPLRSSMQHNPSNWRRDMPGCWRRYIRNVQPDFNPINFTKKVRNSNERRRLVCDSETVVFPGRRAARPQDAPAGSHIFRAFDGLCPENVRVVILGEDPYAERNIATGLAFECGNISQWEEMRPGMKRLMQHWAEYYTRNEGQYLLSHRGVSKLKSDLSAGHLDSALRSRTPSNFFESWRSQGVLMLNTALTYTEEDHKDAHRRLWAPVIRAICRKLAKQQRPMVFLALGWKASMILSQSEVFNSYRGRKKFALHFHPSSRDREFLDGPNIFNLIDRHLTTMEAPSICW